MIKRRYIRGLTHEQVRSHQTYATWKCASCLYNLGQGRDERDPGGPPLVICSSLFFRGRRASPRYGNILATVQKYQELSCPGYRDISTTINGRAPVDIPALEEYLEEVVRNEETRY